MPVNKELMLKILKALAEIYPEQSEKAVLLGLDGPDYEATITYLLDHEMIDAIVRDVMGKVDHRVLYPKITKKGYDYLQDDGGLDAHFRTITVKIDQESIAMLIESHIFQANLPQEKKSSLAKAVRSLPGDVLKHLVLKLAEQGLARTPDALQLIGKFAGLSF